jgi:hypothetical protein
MEDGKIVPTEALSFTLFKEILIPRQKAPSKRWGLLTKKKEITHLLAFLSVISISSIEEQSESFKLGMQNLYKDKVELLPKLGMKDIVSGLEITRDLVPFAKKTLLETSLAVISHKQDKSLNTKLFFASYAMS